MTDDLPQTAFSTSLVLKALIPFFLMVCILTATPAFSQPASLRKPSIAVVEYKVNYPVTFAVGRDLSDILVNALVESQRFTVVDRSRTDELLKEQKSVLMGTVDPATGAQIGKMTGAQYLVLGSVTEFREKQGTAGALLNKVPLFGGKNNKIVSYEATLKLNLRVMNSTTGEIVFSKSIEAKAQDTGVSMNSVYGGVAVGDSFESKAMHKAVEQATQESVALLTERIGSFGVTSGAEAASGGTVNCAGNAVRNKRIMVVIPEIHITQRIPDPAGETEIIRKLVNQGFNVIDQQQIAAIRDREKVLVALRDTRAAAALGAEFRADIIIIGEAFSERAGNQGNLVTTRARVEARAVQTDTARILAADGKFGTGLDVAEFVSAKGALRNAGSSWGDYFLSQMCRSSPLTAANPTVVPAVFPAGNSSSSASSVEILVSNVSFIQLKQFGDRLERIAGVVKVEKKLTGNVARVDVQFEGTAEKLADAIAVTRFGLMRVNIVGLSGNKIEIKIGK